MRRAILAFLLLCALAAPASAQFTQVTGTVTDTNSVPYSCGTITASLVNNSGVTPKLNGQPFTGVTSPVQLGCPTLSGSGAPGSFIMRLADNTVINCPTAANPAAACSPQTQWLFLVNINGGNPPLGTGP